MSKNILRNFRNLRALKAVNGRGLMIAGLLAGTISSVAIGINDADAKSRAEWKQEYQRPSEVPFPEENPYTQEKADLGHMLFFDPRLSGADYISCGTCHNPAFAWGDGLPTGFGHRMTQLGRRTPTVLNSAFGELMMWDGRFEDLEEQALGPMAAEAEMNQPLDVIAEELNAIPGYRNLFAIAFPDDGVTIENIAKAIATYERTIVSGIAPFDRWIAGDEGAISEAAKRGFDLFNGKANCVACHSGWNFTDSSFHDIGLDDDDPGRGSLFPNNVKMQFAFKTPTLRSVQLRAPFMHDGSLMTLTEVMRHYNTGGIQRPSLSDDMKPLGLNEQEISDVVAFMLTLDGADRAVTIPVLPPSEQGAVASLQSLSPAAGPAAPSGGAENNRSDACRMARLHLRNCDQ